MKRFQRNQMHMLSQSISLAAGSGKTLLLSVFFFLTGISTGIFLELTMGAGEKSNIAGYLQQYLYMDQGAMEYPNPFFSSLSNNLFLLLIIFLSGLSALGFPVALAALTYKGMALGFCTGLIAETLKDQGLLVILTSLVPQNLFLLPAFILASAAAVNYALLSLAKKRAAKRNLREFSGSYLCVTLLLAAVIALGCGLEAILYPVVLSP
ncbi:stage II sporulation protein M [Zhenpiania hominis]|uniref:Stage II sporulation protein M n=1 Tax=Zhenpiania hominis TaxID=2763644 RepID=A0A923NRB2_9FIRM|nr:stage II sporulation protein M [Zhenpiania hominis]MBC6681260.1 stage II sporulation protein M [Zhenpiania hominis]